MTITIRLKTDNAAFGDGGLEGYPDSDKYTEVTRIIRQWLARGIRDARLLDINGNAVGTVTVTGK